MKRPVDKVIVHCSASGPKTTVEDIRRWHKEKGWSDIGYHIVILSDGSIKTGRDATKDGAHCEGQNKNSIGVCLVGGNDGKVRHPFSPKQFEALDIVLEGLMMTYGPIPVYPHRYFNKGKECPGFELKDKVDNKKYKIYG